MASFTKFEEIEAWKTAEAIVVLAYGLLKDQLQRASVSIMCNISEGFESRSDRTFHDMLRRAKGSCGEVRTLTYIAAKIGHIPLEKYESLRPLCMKCSSQIQALMTHLESTRPEVPSRERW